MIDNFSWVVPGRLAGAALPGAGIPWSGEARVGAAPSEFARVDPYLLSDLQELREKGVRRLVSLTEYARSFGPACRRAGLEWTYFSIPDFAVPESLGDFARLVDSVTADVAAGRPVCVHCYAGIGRTGLLLACVVGRYLRLDAAEAIRCVRATRRALETDEQERFVERILQPAG